MTGLELLLARAALMAIDLAMQSARKVGTEQLKVRQELVRAIDEEVQKQK